MACGCMMATEGRAKGNRKAQPRKKVKVIKKEMFELAEINAKWNKIY